MRPPVAAIMTHNDATTNNDNYCGDTHHSDTISRNSHATASDAISMKTNLTTKTLLTTTTMS